jgi:hypothetical protein
LDEAQQGDAGQDRQQGAKCHAQARADVQLSHDSCEVAKWMSMRKRGARYK